MTARPTAPLGDDTAKSNSSGAAVTKLATWMRCAGALQLHPHPKRCGAAAAAVQRVLHALRPAENRLGTHRPNTATLVPGLTLAVLNTAPQPVEMPQPSRHTCAHGNHEGGWFDKDGYA